MFRDIRKGKVPASSNAVTPTEITDKMRVQWKLREYGYRISEGTAIKESLPPAINIARKAGLSPDDVTDAVVEGHNHYQIAHPKERR